MKTKFRPTPPPLPIQAPKAEKAPDMGQLADTNVAQSEVLKEDFKTPFIENPALLGIPPRPVFDEDYEGRMAKWRAECAAIEMHGGTKPDHSGWNHAALFGGTKEDWFQQRVTDEVVMLWDEGVRDPHDLWMRAEKRASVRTEKWWHPLKKAEDPWTVHR